MGRGQTRRFARTVRPVHRPYSPYDPYGFIKIIKYMPYDPNLHHRRSIRLKGYDYSQSGYYYITLCVKNNDCLFGEIVDHQMNLNDAGKMVEKWVHELGHKYPDIECGEYVVMPNHFHCIIENNGKGNPNMKDNSGIVRANLRVCPLPIHQGKHVGLPVRSLNCHSYLDSLSRCFQ